MAKSKAPQGKTQTLGFFAYAAMIFNALAWLISMILDLINTASSVSSILKMLASLILTGLVLYVAYGYVKRLTKTWRIIYWILAIVSILAILVGVGVNFAQ